MRQLILECLFSVGRETSWVIDTHLIGTLYISCNHIHELEAARCHYRETQKLLTY